jgi:DNA-binding response OmpR family regulator
MAKSSARKMQDYRARLRAAGLRPVQIWVPDVTTPDFAARARAQSVRVSGSAAEQDTLDFLDAAADDLITAE